MAIQVNGTEVISNSRALNNIASVDATTVEAFGAAGVGGSPTAQSWLGRPAASMNSSGYGMTFANGRFINARYSGIFYSDDGISWTKSTISGTAASGVNLVSATYCGNNIWLVVGDGSRIYRSTNNGANFTHISSSVNAYIGGVASNADNSIQVIACQGSNGLWYSTNTGQTWTQVSGTAGNNFYGVGFGNGRFMSAKPGTNQTLTSTNGSSWTYVNAPTSTVSNMYYLVAAPVYGNGIWAIPLSGGQVIVSSNDGASWSVSRTNIGYQTHSIHYANGAWLLTGENNHLFKADDHTSGSTTLAWAQIPSAFSGATYGIAYGDDKWCVSINGTTCIMTST